MTRRTVSIRVQGETWRVPRGFGSAYKRFAAEVISEEARVTISSVIDLLALVGYHATEDQVACWSLRQRVEALVHAATEHARASDNPVQRHPHPAWLPEQSWQGPWRGDGAFAGPTGTAISTMEEGS